MPAPRRAVGSSSMPRLPRCRTCWVSRQDRSPCFTEAATPFRLVGCQPVRCLKNSIPPGARRPVHQHPIINAGSLMSGDGALAQSGGGLADRSGTVACLQNRNSAALHPGGGFRVDGIPAQSRRTGRTPHPAFDFRTTRIPYLDIVDIALPNRTIRLILLFKYGNRGQPRHRRHRCVTRDCHEHHPPRAAPVAHWYPRDPRADPGRPARWGRRSGCRRPVPGVGRGGQPGPATLRPQRRPDP